MRSDVRLGYFSHIPFPPVELFAHTAMADRGALGHPRRRRHRLPTAGRRRELHRRVHPHPRRRPARGSAPSSAPIRSPSTPSTSARSRRAPCATGHRPGSGPSSAIRRPCSSASTDSTTRRGSSRRRRRRGALRRRHPRPGDDTVLSRSPCPHVRRSRPTVSARRRRTDGGANQREVRRPRRGEHPLPSSRVPVRRRRQVVPHRRCPARDLRARRDGRLVAEEYVTARRGRGGVLVSFAPVPPKFAGAAGSRSAPRPSSSTRTTAMRSRTRSPKRGVATRRRARTRASRRWRRRWPITVSRRWATRFLDDLEAAVHETPREPCRG